MRLKVDNSDVQTTEEEKLLQFGVESMEKVKN